MPRRGFSVKIPTVLVTALFYVLVTVAAPAVSLAQPKPIVFTLPASPPMPTFHFHIDASFRLLPASGSHAYSDAVEETREESGLRIIAAAGILLAVLEHIHGDRLAKMHRLHPDPPPCDCQPAQATPAPAPSAASPQSSPAPRPT